MEKSFDFESLVETYEKSQEKEQSPKSEKSNIDRYKNRLDSYRLESKQETKPKEK